MLRESDGLVFEIVVDSDAQQPFSWSKVSHAVPLVDPPLKLVHQPLCRPDTQAIVHMHSNHH